MVIKNRALNCENCGQAPLAHVVTHDDNEFTIFELEILARHLATCDKVPNGAVTDNLNAQEWLEHLTFCVAEEPRCFMTHYSEFHVTIERA